MKASGLYEYLRHKLISMLCRQVDWKLFMFLVLMLNVKTWVKISALVLIYGTRFNFRFGFPWKYSGLPPFYFGIMLIALVDWAGYGLFRNNRYGLVMLTGLFFWFCCILAIHQIRLSVERSSPAEIQNALGLFFVLNMAISFSNLLGIIWETGAWNPYLFQGLYQKYFIGTGDYIKGISFDSSTTNALINDFAVIWYLNRKNILCTAGCMIALLLTGSNLSNILLALTLLFVFIFQSDRDQKSLITVCLIFLIVFLGRVSPQNNQYFLSAIKSMLNLTERDLSANVHSAGTNEYSNPAGQKRDAIAIAYLDSLRNSWAQPVNSISATPVSWARPEIPTPDINSVEYQRKMDTSLLQRKFARFADAHYSDSAGFLYKMRREKLPGKIIALRETGQFLIRHPGRLITGNGMGNFSSKLAFRVSALDIAGKYPSRLAYINQDFKENHLRLYLYYFTQHNDVHSVIHTADSVLNQLAGEYGLAGVFCFLFYYLGWFARRIRKRSMGLPLLMIMTGAFFTGYWFEQLSVVILFELLMMLSMKEPDSLLLLNKKLKNNS